MKKPDIYGKRYRPIRSNVCSTEFVKAFKKEHPEYAHMTNTEIKKVVYVFNTNLWHAAIQKRDGVELPQRLGHIFVGTCPKKIGINHDYKRSQEYQALIQHRNWESDSYLAKIFYTTFDYRYNYHNHDLWGFNPCRDFKRTLSKEYPKLWKQYLEVPNRLKLSRLFKSLQEQQDKVVNNTVLLETYNEFEI